MAEQKAWDLASNLKIAEDAILAYTWPKDIIKQIRRE
jgi:hypothetical protein